MIFLEASSVGNYINQGKAFQKRQIELIWIFPFFFCFFILLMLIYLFLIKDSKSYSAKTMNFSSGLSSKLSSFGNSFTSLGSSLPSLNSFLPGNTYIRSKMFLSISIFFIGLFIFDLTCFFMEIFNSYNPGQNFNLIDNLSKLKNMQTSVIENVTSNIDTIKNKANEISLAGTININKTTGATSGGTPLDVAYYLFTTLQNIDISNGLFTDIGKQINVSVNPNTGTLQNSFNTAQTTIQNRITEIKTKQTAINNGNNATPSSAVPGTDFSTVIPSLNHNSNAFYSNLQSINNLYNIISKLKTTASYMKNQYNLSKFSSDNSLSMLSTHSNFIKGEMSPTFSDNFLSQFFVDDYFSELTSSGTINLVGNLLTKFGSTLSSSSQSFNISATDVLNYTQVLSNSQGVFGGMQFQLISSNNIECFFYTMKFRDKIYLFLSERDGTTMALFTYLGKIIFNNLQSTQIYLSNDPSFIPTSYNFNSNVGNFSNIGNFFSGSFENYIFSFYNQNINAFSAGSGFTSFSTNQGNFSGNFTGNFSSFSNIGLKNWNGTTLLKNNNAINDQSSFINYYITNNDLFYDIVWNNNFGFRVQYTNPMCGYSNNVSITFRDFVNNINYVSIVFSVNSNGTYSGTMQYPVYNNGVLTMSNSNLGVL